MQHSMTNQVTLIGSLNSTPSNRTFESNKRMSRFSIAIKEMYQDKMGKMKEFSTCHNVVVWGKNAELAVEKLDKGNKVALKGRLVNKLFDERNGERRYICEIHAHDILVLGNKVLERNFREF